MFMKIFRFIIVYFYCLFYNYSTNTIILRDLFIEGNDKISLNKEIYKDVAYEKEINVKNDIIDEITKKNKDYTDNNYLTKVVISEKKSNDVKNPYEKREIDIIEDSEKFIIETESFIDVNFKKYVKIKEIIVDINGNEYKLSTGLNFKQCINKDYLKKIIELNAANFKKGSTESLDKGTISFDSFYLKCLKVNNEEINITHEDKIDLTKYKDNDNNTMTISFKKYYDVNLDIKYNETTTNINITKTELENFEDQARFLTFLRSSILNHKLNNKDSFNGLADNDDFFIIELNFDTKKYDKDIDYKELTKYVENTTNPKIEILISRYLDLDIKFLDKEKLDLNLSKLQDIENKKEWDCRTINEIIGYISKELEGCNLDKNDVMFYLLQGDDTIVINDIYRNLNKGDKFSIKFSEKFFKKDEEKVQKVNSKNKGKVTSSHYKDR